MTAELAIRTGLPGVLRSNAYILPPDLSFDEWSSVVRLAEHIAEASPWWLADSMAYGEAKFGEAHSQALPTTEEDPHGVSQARMKQAAWMGQKYPPVTRVPGASYTHHRIAADLPPGDRAYLLGVTVHEKLSTRALIERVHERQEYWRGRAVAPDGAEIETAELPWVASLDDLAPDARQWVESRAPGGSKRTTWISAALATLQWTGVESNFLPGRWRE